ncbi:uncharacterized protein V6R79_013757 [Siganus canaliculatus]
MAAVTDPPVKMNGSGWWCVQCESVFPVPAGCNFYFWILCSVFFLLGDCEQRLVSVPALTLPLEPQSGINSSHSCLQTAPLSAFLSQQSAYGPGPRGRRRFQALCRADPPALARPQCDDERFSIVAAASTFGLCQSIKAWVQRCRDQHEPASLTALQLYYRR